MAGATPEVVVLGGGPAGCAAASLLARWGHGVIVRTKRSVPSCLAESIPPSAGKLLDLIGLGSAMDAAGFIRSTGNTVWWGDRIRRVEPFTDGHRGWQITRQRFESLLLEHLSSIGVRIESTRQDKGAAIAPEALFTLDCTGRAGVLARRLGMRTYDAARHVVALTGVWRAANAFALPDPTHTLIESYEGGWAWSVPETLDARVVAVMVDPATSGLARAVSPRSIYLKEIARTTEMAALAARAVLVEGPAGWDASMYCSTRYVEENVLLVGDAGSFIDPISSAGVKKALASGWLAAVAVHTSLRRPDMRGVAMRFFDQREAEVYAALRRLTDRTLADAATGHVHAFWADRSDAEQSQTDDDDVRNAFERLRTEPTLRVARNASAWTEDRPAVSGAEIVLQPRLVSRERPDGVRYAFDVDLMSLVDLAPRHASVPDLLTAYNARHAPVALPEFLAALSTAIAQKWLVWV